MKKLLIVLGIVLASFLMMGGCQLETSTSSGLEIQDTVLAKKEADLWQPVPEAIFKKGDTIGIVLLNVKGFKKGDDGLNWLDIDVEVKDPANELILDEKDILGEAGHVNLVDNIAKSPVGYFTTPLESASGKYLLKVTIKDKVGGGEASVSKSFVLE